MTKPNKEQIEAYKEMAKDSSRDMEKCIRRHLEENCPKFKGNEERFEDCIKYVEDCAREILGSRHCGDVADDACYRMARDYFDDELWKEEEEAKAKHAAEAAEAKKKAAKEKKAEALARKKAEAKAKKVTQDFEKEQLDKERERLEKLKEKHGLKAAEPPKNEPEAKKFPTCRVCGREVINVYKEGMCLDCYYKRPMQAEKTPAQNAQIQPEPGQLDFFAAMGV